MTIYYKVQLFWLNLYRRSPKTWMNRRFYRVRKSETVSVYAAQFQVQCRCSWNFQILLSYNNSITTQTLFSYKFCLTHVVVFSVFYYLSVCVGQTAVSHCCIRTSFFKKCKTVLRRILFYYFFFFIARTHSVLRAPYSSAYPRESSLIRHVLHSFGCNTLRSGQLNGCNNVVKYYYI